MQYLFPTQVLVAVAVHKNFVPVFVNPQPFLTIQKQGVSMAQWLGRRTSDPAVMGSIPGPRVIRHLGQLSLPSLRGR